MIKPTPVTVYERNDPTLTFMVSLHKPDGTVVAYPITGRTWEFYVKDSTSVADPAPIAGTVDAASSTPTATAIIVALSATQIGAAGARVYHLDAINAGRRDTVAAGVFNVIDI